MILFLLTLRCEIQCTSHIDDQAFECHIAKHSGIIHVCETSHRWLWPGRRPTHSQNCEELDVKCPVLNTTWALGLVVQGKILALPPTRPGNSGDLPAHPDTQLPWHCLSPKLLLKSLLNKSASAMNRICPLVTRHGGKMLWLWGQGRDVPLYCHCCCKNQLLFFRLHLQLCDALALSLLT